MKVRNLHLTLKHFKVTSLHKIYTIKKKKILEGVSFDVSSKTALVGPNGSGKTMTLSVISQMMKPQEGSVTIGKSSNLLHDENFKKKMGVMIQEGNFDPDKTVLQEMQLVQRLKNDKCDLNKLLKKYNIDSDAAIRSLPHGKYKILLVLQALMGNPELVILDEPFSGLDILNRKIIEDILKKYKGKMLITSHLLTEIKNICTDVVFLREGKVIEKKNMKQIRNLDKYYIKLFS